MKHLIAATVIVFLLFSCKKETGLSANNSSNPGTAFFQKVKAQLKDSLSTNDYSSIDMNQLLKSKDAQSDGYFVRGAFRQKDVATDFILLKTDSLGNIKQGKIIHVDKKMDGRNVKNLSFQGQFIINSLNRKEAVIREVMDGRWKKKPQAPTAREEEPVGEQDLPEVVVTSYSYDTGYSDWYWYNGFYDDYSYGGGGYTYGAAGGGGGSSSNDNTIVIEVEPNDNPAIKVEDYMKCFSTIPDANATYQITICTDIPVDSDPSQMFNWSTGSPGHSFIQLTKTSGSTSIQQNIGFYPQVGWKTLGSYPTASKVVDNGGHEYNASLTQTISSSQFQTTINRMESLGTKDYDIAAWNCTDFALSVYNAATDTPLSIPQYITEGSSEAMNTPQGLYSEIQTLKTAGDATHGTPNVPSSEAHAGQSHGSCGN